jgi:hypothetical protein
MFPRLFLLLFLWHSTSSQANMAYWGPQPGNVAGRNTSPDIRVQKEWITADMRQLPDGKIRVFADYILESKAQSGNITFLFVASGKNPVHPEIILDGVVTTSIKSISALKYTPQGGNYRNLPWDSMTETIGMELEKQTYFQQVIESELWSFTLFLAPGKHRLKIGYELTATAFDRQNLRYHTFPYYLGNQFTRPLYDTIILRTMLPDGLSYEGNIGMQQKGNIFQSENLARFKGSHIYISVYKDVQQEITSARNWLYVANYCFAALLVLLTFFGLRRLMRLRGRIGFWCAMVFPVAIVSGLFYFCSLYYFYSHFKNVYGNFLNGGFGNGYYFLVVPFVAGIAAGFWLVLVLVLRFTLFKKYAKGYISA